jgi:hypothetical protein
MTRLQDVENHVVVAIMLAATYELASRLEVTPRTVLDGAFSAAVGDERWPDLQMALAERLG